jgi:antitoxin component YwqK of YwqJK toxin-antitoxin module
MKIIFAALLLGLALNAKADTFLLKDGARLEGEVTGEMDGLVLVQTKYGSLSIKRTDIQEQKAALPAPAPAVSAQAAPALSTMTAAAVSTEAAAAVSTALPAPAEAPAPKLTFATILPSTGTRLLIYSENGVAIATETLSASGAQVSFEGAIKDGTYTEYYENGGLKTVKTFSGNKTSGTLKAFYPAGSVQIEAYYLGGAKEGPLKYYGEDGKLLMEAEYQNDKLNGWKKEYDAAGAVKSGSFYADDHLAEPPKPQPPAEQAKEEESPVTVKALSLARGERFTFQLNGKYAGRANLDKDFNIISLDGTIPDGSVKVYAKDGKIQKEFIFVKSAIKLLRVFEPGGQLKAEYTFIDDKAIKK